MRFYVLDLKRLYEGIDLRCIRSVSYTHLDDVTGVFTVTTATLNASSKLTFKAEKMCIRDSCYSKP